jgi:hypothetical protein
MDTTSLENALNQDDSEATYRALRDSILQIYQFGTKIAKESNPDNELQVSWELGDTSLMNWISDTHCYLSRKGQKLQFLARPSKLEIISFSLVEGDKLLICSDTLRQNLSDNEIDEILQESSGSENACQNLLKIVNVNSQSRDNVNNIVVMEVINNQKVITPIPIVDTKQAENKSSSKFNPLWLLLPLLLLFIGGLAWFSVNNTLNFKNLFGFSNRQVAVEDTITFLNKNKDSLDLAKANTIITKEFETEKLEENFPEQKDDFATTPKSIEKEEIKTKSGSNSFAKKSILKISTKNNSSSANNKGEVSFPNTSSKNLDIANEEQNYNALIQQREKWTTIKNDLQGTLSSGNAAAAEKLKNSEKVLERIEEKIRESAKKLGRN